MATNAYGESVAMNGDPTTNVLRFTATQQPAHG